MKRIFDVVLSSVGLLLLAIPLLILIFAVRRKLGTPVFFRQVRPGMHGKPFQILSSAP